jgi:hypothetical protein
VDGGVDAGEAGDSASTNKEARSSFAEMLSKASRLAIAFAPDGKHRQGVRDGEWGMRQKQQQTCATLGTKGRAEHVDLAFQRQGTLKRRCLLGIEAANIAPHLPTFPLNADDSLPIATRCPVHSGVAAVLRALHWRQLQSELAIAFVLHRLERLSPTFAPSCVAHLCAKLPSVIQIAVKYLLARLEVFAPECLSEMSKQILQILEKALPGICSICRYLQT